MTLIGEELIEDLEVKDKEEVQSDIFTDDKCEGYLNYRTGKSAATKDKPFKGSEAFINSLKKTIDIKNLFSVEQNYCIE